MAIRCILVPLIGLPGVGKTTFCQNVIKFLSEGHSKNETDDELTERAQAVVFHLRYDEFLPRILTTSDDENTTKRYRQAAILVVDCVLQTLANDVKCRTVADILAGTRLHLAEKEPTLPPETIDSAETILLSDLSRVILRILRELHDPVMPFTLEREGQVSDEQRSLDRQASYTSILHQSDMKLRSLVGQRMKMLKLLGEVFDAKSEASKLNQIKSRIYEKLKKGDIQVDLDGIDSELETLFFDEIEL